MMLNPAVIKEHKGVSMLDSKWIGLAGFEVDRLGFAGRDCDCGVFDVPTVR